MIIMKLKRKIGLIAAGLITLSGVSIIEEIYVYGNEKNKSNIQLEEYEIKDLANLIGKNKIDVENILGKGYEKEILQQESKDVYKRQEFKQQSNTRYKSTIRFN